MNVTVVSEFNVVFVSTIHSLHAFFFFNTSNILIYYNLDGICGGFLSKVNKRRGINEFCQSLQSLDCCLFPMCDKFSEINSINFQMPSL